jgi:tetratricopeptide (TPR) repeat protein
VYQHISRIKKPIAYGLLAFLILAILAIIIFQPPALALYHQVKGGMILRRVILTAQKTNPNAIACDLEPVQEDSARTQLKQAIAHLEAARHYAPKLAQTYLLLGRAFCLMGEAQNAVEAAEKYISLRPNNPLGHLELGFAYDAEGNEARASSEWEQSTVAAIEFLNIGKQKVIEKQYASALNWYNRAAQLGMVGDAAYFKGMAYQDQMRYPEALGTYQEALELKNFQEVMVSDVYYRLGFIYQWAQGYQNFQKALDMYDLAIKYWNFSSLEIAAEAYYKRGEIYEWIGRDPEQSIIEYQKAITIRPNHPWAHLRLGYNLYKQTKDVSLAEAEIKWAIVLWVDAQYAKWPYRFLGDIYLDAGLTDKALIAYQEALSLDPEDKEVLNIIASLQAGKSEP